MLAHLARVLADELHVARDDVLMLQLEAMGASGTAIDPATFPALPHGAEVAMLGQVHEVLVDRRSKRRRGAFYTPPDVARSLVGIALRDDAMPGAVTVCDPTAGGGAFLLGAAELLAGRGIARDVVVEELIWGADIDALAVAVTEASLVLWAASNGRAPARANLAVADTLLTGTGAWSSAALTFDVVVGNPPFQSQLAASTARSSERAELLRERFGGAVFRYTDDAALFLLAACRMARDGGRVALILPQSFLVGDDTKALRRAVLEVGSVEEFWVATDHIFDAHVRVCAPVVRVGHGAVGPVRRHVGRSFTPAPPLHAGSSRLRDEPTWASLASDLLGAPPVTLDEDGTLRELCEATAGFRDQFYGLVSFVEEAGDNPDGARARLVTSGLIDPARCHWGARATRFAGARWRAPEIDLVRLEAADPTLAAWARARLVPKVLVATQTRVIEAVVDESGSWFPSVPTIAVVAEPDRLWHVAAVLLAPPISALAFARHSGAALSATALRVSARQVLDLPCPAGTVAWDRAVPALQRAAAAPTQRGWREELEVFGAAMCDAYGVDHGVLAWWVARLPTRRVERT